jgi:hypothetical protein
MGKGLVSKGLIFILARLNVVPNLQSSIDFATTALGLDEDWNKRYEKLYKYLSKIPQKMGIELRWGEAQANPTSPVFPNLCLYKALVSSV